MVSRSCTQPIRISDGLVDLRVPHVLMSTSGGTHHLSICMDPMSLLDLAIIWWSTHPLTLCMALWSSCMEMGLVELMHRDCGLHHYLSTGTQLADVVMLVGTVDVVFGSVDL